MTTKHKAYRLVMDHFLLTNQFDYAKKSALLTVEYTISQLIDVHINLGLGVMGRDVVEAYIKYWKELRDEIEKLTDPPIDKYANNQQYNALNILEYNGYKAEVSVSFTDGILHGKIIGIADLVSFEAESIYKIKRAFREAVDYYVLTLLEINQNK